MTQKEKYKRAASAMRKALVSIMSDGPSTEYLLRDAKDEIRAALPYEDSDYWRADAPAEGVAVEAEKLETEGEPEKLTRAAVLEKARACVCGEREEDYGSPEDSFGCIAELWEAYLRAACIAPNAVVTVTPADVAMLMALLKIARAKAGSKPDTYIDLAGYAACGAEISERDPKRTASTSDADGGTEAGKTASCVKLQRMDGYYLVDVDGNPHRFTLWETAMQFIRDQAAEERKKKT